MHHFVVDFDFLQDTEWWISTFRWTHLMLLCYHMPYSLWYFSTSTSVCWDLGCSMFGVFFPALATACGHINPVTALVNYCVKMICVVS